jgi:ABC-type antimicrobial peptide transport system permease subunit
MSDTDINTLNKYKEKIKYGYKPYNKYHIDIEEEEHVDEDIKSLYIYDIIKKIKSLDINNYSNKNDELYTDNNNKNNLYTNNQIRLNNLKEIDNSKQVAIYILYIVLIISCMVLFFLLR